MSTNDFPYIIQQKCYDGVFTVILVQRGTGEEVFMTAGHDTEQGRKSVWASVSMFCDSYPESVVC